jgi:AcrR family transcriptional regulator
VSNRRERILEAATEVFAAKGLAGSRVDEISQKSKCNKQLIYYYFKSKQGLYDAVLRRLIERTHELFEGRDDEGVDLWRLPSEDPLYTPLWRRFWMWEALEAGRRGIPLEKERRAVFKRISKSIAKAQENGEVADEFDPEMLHLALSAMQQYPFIFPQLTKFTAGESPDSPKFKRRQAKFMQQLLARLDAE